MDSIATNVSMREVRATYKVRDSWWTVLLVDPLAGRLARIAARRVWLTPNRLTITAFLLGLAAAAAFLTGAAGWLVIGVLLYHLSFVIDCVDGKLARLTGSGSVFGGWLDFFLDRIRVIACGVALFSGQFLATDRPIYLFAATGFVFLALFGYVNGAETDKARAKLAGPATQADQPTPADRELAGRELAGDQALPDDQALAGRERSDDQALLAAAPAGRVMTRVREALHRRRIRMNLVSGIEFEMAVLVVAPLLVTLTGPTALLWVTGVAAGLLALFELALIGRFWLATRTAAGHAPAATPTASGGPPSVTTSANDTVAAPVNAPTAAWSAGAPAPSPEPASVSEPPAGSGSPLAPKSPARRTGVATDSAPPPRQRH